MQSRLTLQIVVLLYLLRISDDFALVVFIVHVRCGGHAVAILRGRCLKHWLHVHGLGLRIGLLHVLQLLRGHGTNHVRVHEAIHAWMCALEGSDRESALLVRESVAHDELERALCIERALCRLGVESFCVSEVQGLTVVLESGV